VLRARQKVRGRGEWARATGWRYEKEILMKAIVQDRYGSVDLLRLAEVDQPVMGADEVLVRVRAASVHADVWHVVTGLPYVLRLMGSGLSQPKNPIPGTDMAGIVEAVGTDVTQF
jgi:NADPH:quinone reductase-like Zn-dependent oxidoreductase